MMGHPKELWVACHGVAAAARHNFRGGVLRGFSLLEFDDIGDVSLEGWRAMSREAFFDMGKKNLPCVVRAKGSIDHFDQCSLTEEALQHLENVYRRIMEN